MIGRTNALLCLWTCFGLAVAGCTTADLADDGEEQAKAVEPESGDDDSLVDSRTIVDERPFDIEAITEAVEQSGDESLDEAIGALGMRPDSEYCDGAPCRDCQEGTDKSFVVDEADLAVRSCCSINTCVSQWSFDDGQSTLVVIGDPVEPVVISPDARSVVLPSQAWSGDGEAIAVVALDELEAMAQPIDESSPVVIDRQLVDQARWTLEAESLHRLQALSARAIEEGQTPCQTGVHLPTLFEQSDDADPLSEGVLVGAVRWASPSNLVADTIDPGREDTSSTLMQLDLEGECMERFTARDQWSRVSADVAVDEPFSWVSTTAELLDDGERPFTRINGQLLVRGEIDDVGKLGSRDIAADVYDGGQPVADESIAVARRAIGRPEIDWLLQYDESPHAVSDPAIDSPWFRQGDVVKAEVTIVVDGAIDDPEVHLSVQ